MARVARYAITGAGALLGLACQAEAPQPSVTYGSSPALGTWSAPPSPPSGVEPASMPMAGAGEVPVAGSGGAGGQGGGVTATAGTGATGESGGTGGAGGAAGMSAPDPTAGADGMTAVPGSDTGLSSMTFQVLTHSQGGRYAPKNIGAIWVETSAGGFVKTLEVWAGTRARYLRRWNTEASGSRVDAVSSATLRSHVAHTATWDLADVSGAPVAPGDYKLVIEVTDANVAGQSLEIPFTYGEALSISPPDAPYYTGMALTVQ